eukprot:gene2317-biopygen4172
METLLLFNKNMNKKNKKNKNKIHNIIGHNKIGNVGAVALADALNLTANNISNEGAHDLVETLKYNSTLIELRLDGNNISSGLKEEIN